MNKRIEGRVLRLGRDVTLEWIAPQQCLPMGEAPEAFSQLLETSGSRRKRDIGKGDVIVAGGNFGMGQEPQNAVQALKAAEVPCIVAASFARPFYRCAINQGLPLIESLQAHEKISDGETVSIDFDKWEINCKRGAISFPSFPEIIGKIIESGGLIPYAKKSIGK
jgi:3-isopropylmalate dehydratase small subunit